LVPTAPQKIPVQPARYLPPQKIPLAVNMFLQAGKGTKNTKEKSRQCFPCSLPYFPKTVAILLTPLVCIHRQYRQF